MHSKNLIYKYGHFYENGKRIELNDDSKICIVANEKDFILEPQDLIYKQKIKSEKELEVLIKSDKKVGFNKKIFDRGKMLYFYIAISDIKHEFAVELLEDLYFFRSGKSKSNDLKLYDCACVVKNNLTNTITFFEEVYAKSLNELYKKTYVHYFRNNGSPSCNAIDRFYELAGNDDLNLRKYRD